MTFTKIIYIIKEEKVTEINCCNKNLVIFATFFPVKIYYSDIQFPRHLAFLRIFFFSYFCL